MAVISDDVTCMSTEQIHIPVFKLKVKIKLFLFEKRYMTAKEALAVADG